MRVSSRVRLALACLAIPVTILGAGSAALAGTGVPVGPTASGSPAPSASGGPTPSVSPPGSPPQSVSPTLSDIPTPSFSPSLPGSPTPTGGPQPSDSPTAPAGTGGISGHLRTATGDPVASAGVSLYDSTFGYLGFDDTDGTGAFSFTGIAPGSYTVSFWYNGGTQWYHSRAEESDADFLVVSAGQVSVADDVTLPGGVITGTLTDSTGQPVGGASVYASSSTGGGSGYGRTSSDGHYSLSLLAGTYTVSFTAGGTASEYAHHSLSLTTATQFVLGTGQTLTVDEQLLPTGSVSGHFSAADGTPLSGVSVQLLTGDGGSGGYATTAGDGSYSVPGVYAGSYQVLFTLPDWTTSQYAHGKLTADQADTYTVTAGADTVVDDSALPTGSVKLSAKDATTGKKINTFCAYADGHEGCTTTGSVTIAGVRVGHESVGVYTNDGHYYSADPVTLLVTAGQTTAATVTLRPGATITVVVKDRATGQPVENACADAIPTTAGMLPDGFAACSDAQGVLRIGPLAAGRYTLYVAGPWESGYGAQWVGSNGGVGIQGQAAVIKVGAGKFATGPTILLDPAGTITGTVTDPSGQPIRYALVTASAFDPGAGPSGPGGATDAAGHYTITGLGPYAWPLHIGAEGFADQWTGGVARRTSATAVTVVAGGTTIADVRLVAGVTLSGTVRGPGGVALTGGRVVVYDAVTGDVVGVSEVDGSGGYRVPLLASQKVKLRFWAYHDGDPEGWYGGTSLDTATVIAVHAKNLTRDIQLG